MRVLFLFLSLLLGMTTIQAQYVNGVHLDEIDATYIGVTTQYPWLNGNLRAFVDVGQEVRDTRWNRNILSDREDDTIRFNSEIHLFNFLDELGYVFLQEVYITSDNMMYLFKRERALEIEEPEQMNFFASEFRD